MPAGSSTAVEFRGLREFRDALRAMGNEWPKELRRINKQIADEGAARSQGVARGMGGVQSRAAGSIKGRAESDAAKIGISGGKRVPFANVAYWGAKRRTGWYAAQRYAQSTRQHDPWVGNSWEAAGPGGPYAINPAMRAYLPALMKKYEDMVNDLGRRAFGG